MTASYERLLKAADICLRLKRSLIVTATFSREHYQLELLKLLAKNPHAKPRIIWCIPINDSEDEVGRRLSRGFGEGCYTGSVTSLERYLDVKERFQKTVRSSATSGTTTS